MTVESKSGLGSYLCETVAIREKLPLLIYQLGVRSFLDAPCGDFNWMKKTNLGVERYIGLDILPENVADNTELYSRPGVEFEIADIVRTDLPKVDMIFSRDCLVHLTLESATKALGNFERSGSKYLVATTYPNIEYNFDLDSDMGGWRKLNLQLPPFTLGKPLQIIHEAGPRCEPGQDDYGKALGVWSLQTEG